MTAQETECFETWFNQSGYADMQNQKDIAREAYRAAWDTIGKELAEAIEGVIAIADRKTDEFDKAKAQQPA